MNKEIASITNITSSVLLDATGTWSLNTGLPLADECVVRQVTYSSNYATKSVYLIRSSLTNGILGAISNIQGFTSNPGSRIQLYNPPQNIQFQLVTPAGAPVIVATGDFIAINMDFISYKK